MTMTETSCMMTRSTTPGTPEPVTRRTTRSVGAAGPRAKPARRVKGNGNLTQVLDATATNNISIAAHYEYDPYGNVIHSSGPYKDANPFRFSTKWFDEETHLGYWGYRYYSPRLGRWLSRDPMSELGGFNLHVFCMNNPIRFVDTDGRGVWDALEAAGRIVAATAAGAAGGAVTGAISGAIVGLLVPPIPNVAAAGAGLATGALAGAIVGGSVAFVNASVNEINAAVHDGVPEPTAISAINEALQQGLVSGIGAGTTATAGAILASRSIQISVTATTVIAESQMVNGICTYTVKYIQTGDSQEAVASVVLKVQRFRRFEYVVFFLLVFFPPGAHLSSSTGSSSRCT